MSKFPFFLIINFKLFQKKKQYQAYAKAIKLKAEALNGKVKELKLKEQNMKNLVPVEEYNKLKLHLKSIANRHQAFSKMIFNGDANFNPNNTNQLMGNFKSVPDMTGLNYDEPKDQFMSSVFKTEQLIIDTGDKSHLNENKNAFISPIENSHKTNPLVSQSSFYHQV